MLFVILAAAGCGSDVTKYESSYGWIMEYPSRYELQDNSSETNTTFNIPSESTSSVNSLIVVKQRLFGARQEFVDVQKAMREGLESQGNVTNVRVNIGEHASGEVVHISFQNLSDVGLVHVMQALMRNPSGDHVFLSMSAMPDDARDLRIEFDEIVAAFQP